MLRSLRRCCDDVFRRQKVHAIPLSKTNQSIEEDLQHEAWKDLLSTWRSRVSCLSAEVVHVTADIRLSPIVEKIRCDSPVDANKTETTGLAVCLSDYFRNGVLRNFPAFLPALKFQSFISFALSRYQAT